MMTVDKKPARRPKDETEDPVEAAAAISGDTRKSSTSSAISGDTRRGISGDTR